MIDIGKLIKFYMIWEGGNLSRCHHKALAWSKTIKPEDSRVWLVALPHKEWQKKKYLKENSALPKPLGAIVRTFVEASGFEAKSGQHLSLDLSPTSRLILVFMAKTGGAFEHLTAMRNAIVPLETLKPKTIFCDLRGRTELLEGITDATVAAVEAVFWSPPKYASKPPKPKTTPTITFATDQKALLSIVQGQLQKSYNLAQATNMVRHLTMRAGNDLTCKTYTNEAKQIAKDLGAKFEFLNVTKLKALNAGAFLAVCQGSAEQDAGIVKLTYSPAKKAAKHLCLVGKGVVYDTGGTNLKPARSMYGMHGDMGGSAVALATFRLAVEEQWPCKVSCYLAIAENAIGPLAYRQNDVVTAHNGKTIEIIHTDAEGRMLLADTLAIASEDKPDLIFDFATLTGSCVAAIGTSYSGVFTNEVDWITKLIEAGKASGERIWPFPLDEDFGESLESEIADIMQCRLSGGVDHIEAAYFLKQFLGKGISWVHMDLSASEHEGGLGASQTKVTGFGVRAATQFCRNIGYC